MDLRPDRNDAHTLLDAIRAASAQLVVFGHALAVYPLAAGAVPWVQKWGVLVFFLLSGFLISNTLRRRLTDPASTFRDFALDRWARLYAGYLPALVFVLAVDSLTMRAFPHNYFIDRFTLPNFLANLLMLQDAPLSPFTPFGSNAALWSVAVELWIYLFVGAVAFAMRSGLTWRRMLPIAPLGYIPLGWLLGEHGVFAMWLLGAGAEQVIARGWLERVGVWGLAGGAVVASGAYLLALSGADFRVYTLPTYPLLAVAFACVVALALRSRVTVRLPRLRVGVARLAGYSYTLYLVHHTLTATMEMIAPAAGLAGLAVALAGSNALAIGLSGPERRHRALAAWARSRLARDALDGQFAGEEARGAGRAVGIYGAGAARDGEAHGVGVGAGGNRIDVRDDNRVEVAIDRRPVTGEAAG